jgi:hypothetical protein
MGGKDYIPQNSAKFDAWFNFFNRYVAQKTGGAAPAWTHIPQEARTRMRDAYDAWRAAYEVTIGPHTKVDTAAKNDATKAAVKVIRPFVNQYLRFPPVTDEDRTAVGIPNHDTIRTPIGRPETAPVFSIVIKGIRRVTLPFHDEGSERRAIPYGMSGAVVSWKVSDAPVTNPELLDRAELATRSPHVLHFTEEDRGKTVSIAMRWQTKSGACGDFGEAESAIIP